jgi:thioredoxin reductase (NADPH)
MEKDEVLEFVIIGAGPIGLYAARKLQKHNRKFLIIEKNKRIGGQPSFLYPAKTVNNIPRKKEIIASNIFKMFKPQTFKNKILTNTSVKKMQHEGKQIKIVLSKGRVVFTNNVLICSGLGTHTTNEIDIPGNKKRVIYTVNNIKIFKDKQVVVLGGGYSAVDWAIQISKIAKRVSLIYRGTKLKVSAEEEQKLYSGAAKVFTN